jgi:hypothetical protein
MCFSVLGFAGNQQGVGNDSLPNRADYCFYGSKYENGM